MSSRDVATAVGRGSDEDVRLVTEAQVCRAALLQKDASRSDPSDFSA